VHREERSLNVMEQSDKRIKASQENGKLGGVRTDEGKARSSRNAERFGLYSQRCPVLSTEDSNLFEELRDRHFAEYQPVGTTEVNLVEELTVITWRIRRYWPASVVVVELEMSVQAEHIARIQPTITHQERTGLAVRKVFEKSHTLRDIDRMESRLLRSQERLIRLLHDLQKDRQPKSAKKPQNYENEPRSTAPATPEQPTPQQECAYFPMTNWSNEPWEPILHPETLWPSEIRVKTTETEPPPLVSAA